MTPQPSRERQKRERGTSISAVQIVNRIDGDNARDGGSTCTIEAYTPKGRHRSSWCIKFAPRPSCKKGEEMVVIGSCRLISNAD